MYICGVCLPPGHRALIGCATKCSEDNQGVLGASCVRSDYGLCQGQVYISSFDS